MFLLLLAVGSAAAAAVYRDNCLGIVVPFQRAKLEPLREMTENWVRRKPFVSRPKRCIGLVFYSDRPLQIETKNEIISWVLLSGSFGRNVDIEFISADLRPDEDGYPRGPNHMFMRLFSQTSDQSLFPWLRERFRYIFLMEADTRPVQPGWANAMARDVQNMGTSCVRGSIYFGEKKRPMWYRGHINGNAFYKLDCDYLWRTMEPLVLADNAGYDAVLYDGFMSVENIEITKFYMHMFTYTRFIINMRHDTYNATYLNRILADTYLVHGGQEVPVQ